MRILIFIFSLTVWVQTHSQDTIIQVDKTKFTLAEVIVRNNFDYATLLRKIKEDTTFYKAFRNLRVLEFSSFNDIKMMDKKGVIKASLYSKTKQNRKNGCRTMDVLEEKITGDFYDKNKNYNYNTAELYASLFFTKQSVCGENNIVKGHQLTTANKKGMDKHKEQLKMLFFNPGKKIPGIPFIGDKLDLYDESARKLYDYKLDVKEKNHQFYYVFSIVPKKKLGFLKRDKIVVDEMTTWFDQKTLEVFFRKYTLSYKAGVYDFDVNIEVEMTKYNNYIVPKVLRYYGNWDVVFKTRERGLFTATLFGFEEEKKK